MVLFRQAQREIQFKLVYYGCALGGKTTNIEALHEITDPGGKTELVSLKTAEDRTLFFDFLPFDIGEIEGYQIRLQVYTVPGQVRYNSTRKVVLTGADAIIFVADSQPERAKDNYIAWENMKANLLANRMDIRQIPIVIQCNKQDLPGALNHQPILAAMKIPESERETIASCALTGEGVISTFVRCTEQALWHFAEKYMLTEKGVTAKRLNRAVEEVFQPFASVLRAAVPTVPEPGPAELPEGLNEEEQLVAALESTTKLAEQFQETNALRHLYEERLEEMTVLHDIGLALAGIHAVDEGLAITAALLSEARPNWIVSAFRKDSDGPRPMVAHGVEGDPLWKAIAPGAGNLALGLLQDGKRKRLDNLQERLRRLKVSPLPDVGEALAVPLGPKDGASGFLIVYCPADKSFTKEEDSFFSLLEQVVSPRLQSIYLLEELAAANERLELKVTERTADLKAAFEELKELDQLKRAFLNNVSHEMKTPLTNIRSYADLLKSYPDQREEKADEYLAIVCEESVRLETLINDLLSFTRIKEPPKGESCDLGAVLEETLTILAPRIEEKRLKTKVQKNEDHLEYEINRDDAAVLFRQILGNAIKFSPDGMKLKIYLLNDPKKVVFAVRDYGPGFPEDQRERLLKSSGDGRFLLPSYKTTGLGMGLFLVREITAKYGGGLAIEDMEPGSNVLVEFPKTTGSAKKVKDGA